MISNIRYLFFFLLLGLISCSQKEEFGTEASGDGTLSLSVSLSDKINVVESRSLSSSDTANLANDCRVRIYDSKSLIRKYEGLDNVPSSIVLPSGNYSIRVTAGDSTAASFKKKFFEGKEDFSISYGKNTELDVDCRILNTVVTVTWDESLKKAFSDYKVTVSSTTGKLVYTKDSIDVSGYFCVPDNNRNIFLEFEGKPLVNEEKFILRDTLLTKKSTQYILKYRYNDNYISGGGKVDVSVDEDPLDNTKSDTIIQQRASIFFINNNNKETNLPINEPVYLLKGSNDEHTIWVSSKVKLTSFTVECDNFTGWGLDATQYELIGDNVISNLFSYQSKIEAEKEGDGYNYYYKLGLTIDLMSEITSADGEYSIKVKVVDSESRVRTETINLVVSDATVVTSNIEDCDVWTNRAILRGEATSQLNGSIKFRYKSESSDWIYVTDNIIQSNSSKYSVEISGLSPDTQYEYQICDGSNPSNNSVTFTTDEEFQPENASFEYTKGSKPMFVYGEGQQMWWDTGNTGSASYSSIGVGGDVTTVDKNIKHSGNQSLLLSSDYIVVKFAAGNVFAGKYIRTDGTDGVLGWGRPCTSRPKAMKLWVKYIPGTVDKGGSHIANGVKDNGHIYVAVGDWVGDDSEGETWPFVVRTKNQASLFSTDKGTYSGDGIIGYGEKVFDSNYEDNGGLKELTIPLDYENYGGNSRKPTSIIIVASASKYGDYFEGSTSSQMWLDDIKLIYE